MDNLLILYNSLIRQPSRGPLKKLVGDSLMCSRAGISQKYEKTTNGRQGGAVLSTILGLSEMCLSMIYNSTIGQFIHIGEISIICI